VEKLSAEALWNACRLSAIASQVIVAYTDAMSNEHVGDLPPAKTRSACSPSSSWRKELHKQATESLQHLAEI
jgi:hypothetical protein